MNDGHDNAADDGAVYRRIQTDLTIEAFRKQELKRLQLEMVEYALTKLLTGGVLIRHQPLLRGDRADPTPVRAPARGLRAAGQAAPRGARASDQHSAGSSHAT